MRTALATALALALLTASAFGQTNAQPATPNAAPAHPSTGVPSERGAPQEADKMVNPSADKKPDGTAGASHSGHAQPTTGQADQKKN